MNRISRTPAFLLALTASVLLTACPEDSIEGSGKGEIDRAALEDGVEVAISSGIGTVSVPFSVAVPEDIDEFEDEMEGAVSLVVSNVDSGVSVDLTAGSLISGSPSAPGEWSWDLTRNRDRGDVEFFNEAPGGQALRSSGSYAGTLSISKNDYIETEEAFSFSIDVVGN